MSSPSYPAARQVAAIVKEHFARHIAVARGQGRLDLGVEPDAESIEGIIDTAFWASLRREEGTSPTISLALLPPGHAGQALTFNEWLPLTPAALARLAPAVERPGIHLGVWLVDGTLRVWGTTRSIPAFCFVLEVVGSGLLVVKHRNEPFGKFVNIALLEGDQVKIVDDRSASVPDCPGLLKSLLGQSEGSSGTEPVNVMVHLAASMRAHHRGGALLLVPEGSDEWRESILEPIVYAVAPVFTELADLMAREHDERRTHEWQEDLRRAVDAIAGLTAVDGATLMTTSYNVLAFGAKIVRRRTRPSVERVMVTEPILDHPAEIMTPSQLGGTRHFSAAQFVQDQPEATALVASQDGKFTIFQWSPCELVVHAHRVEALLL
ncbi:MAG: putative sensor domain DACNV-containing protein [Vicinamibacterales bacterium]